MYDTEQRALCAKYHAEFVKVAPFETVGISRNFDSDALPINGLRHPSDRGTSGWYIWRGENLSADPNFFQPVHVTHLQADAPELLRYLGLAPGWRFLLAPGYEDVWFDSALLNI